VVPYTPAEEEKILEACQQIGGGKDHRSGAVYEQLRARAMVMLLRHTALRISDVCTLRRDWVTWDPDTRRWRVFLRTQKTGEAVYLPIPEELKLVLDALPLPRNAAGLPLLLLEWRNIPPRSSRHCREDSSGRVQEIQGKQGPRPSLSPHPSNVVIRARRHRKGSSGHSRKHGGGCPQALRKVVSAAPSEH
jgi:integrase